MTYKRVSIDLVQKIEPGYCSAFYHCWGPALFGKCVWKRFRRTGLFQEILLCRGQETEGQRQDTRHLRYTATHGRSAVILQLGIPSCIRSQITIITVPSIYVQSSVFLHTTLLFLQQPCKLGNCYYPHSQTGGRVSSCERLACLYSSDEFMELPNLQRSLLATLLYQIPKERFGCCSS